MSGLRDGEIKMTLVIKKTKLSMRFKCSNRKCKTEYISNEYIMTFRKANYSEVRLCFEHKCPVCGATNIEASSYWSNPKLGGFAEWINFHEVEFDS